ncbi:MAG TPA: hypothetical protein VLE74_04250 [Candidatus Saccharimonadales bacterium]|nr:hypothetical protein [Candidatus Saccharimonadales bacterium]
MANKLLGSYEAPAALPEEQQALVSPEWQAEASQLLDRFIAFVEGGGQGGAPAFTQVEAHSEKDEAERDEFMRQLSWWSGLDIETRLNNAELAWKTGGDGRVVVKPWMKASLGLDNPTEDFTVTQGGIRRDIPLGADDNNTVYWLHEREFPNVVDEGRERYNRVVYFSAAPLVYTQPEA